MNINSSSNNTIPTSPSTSTTEIISDETSSSDVEISRRVSVASTTQKTNSITEDISNGLVWNYISGSKDGKLTGTLKTLLEE